MGQIRPVSKYPLKSKEQEQCVPVISLAVENDRDSLYSLATNLGLLSSRNDNRGVTNQEYDMLQWYSISIF